MRMCHLVAMTLAMASAAIPGQAQSAANDVRQFVTQHYFAGLPYEEARRFDAEHLPALNAMLAEDQLEPYWANVVVTIGMIGDSSSAEVLVNFFARPEGELSLDHFRALASVPTALGYLAANGSDEALKRLQEWAGLEPWKSLPRWRHTGHRGERLQDLVARMAIQGLGISGQREALETLSTLSRDERLPESWTDNVDDSLELHHKVATLGVEKAFTREEEDQ